MTTHLSCNLTRIIIEGVVLKTGNKRKAANQNVTP